MNQQQNIDFVLEVQKHPCLYQTNLANYSRKSETLKDWEEVGKAMNMSGPECKEKWKNLRAVFLRHLRADKFDGKKMKPYYLSDYMRFIIPFLAPSPSHVAGNSSTDHILETETVYHTIDASDRSSEVQSEYDPRDGDPFLVKIEECNLQPSQSKRQRLSLHETDKSVHLQTVESNDTVTSFLKSLSPELNEMNHDQFKTFKRKVLSLIDDIMTPSF